MSALVFIETHCKTTEQNRNNDEHCCTRFDNNCFLVVYVLEHLMNKPCPSHSHTHMKIHDAAISSFFYRIKILNVLHL